MEKAFSGFLLKRKHTVPSIAVFLHILDADCRVWHRDFRRGGLRLCVKLLDFSLCQLPGGKLRHKLSAFLRRSDIQNVAYLCFPVLLRNVGLQQIQVVPAVAAGICVYLVNGFLFGLFLRRFFLRPDMRPL